MAPHGPSRILLPALSFTLTLLGLAGRAPVTAQCILPNARTDAAHATASPLASGQAASTPSTKRMALGGSLGSAFGLVTGSGIGYGLGHALSSCDAGSEDCGEGWDMLGALVGSVVGSALGSRLAASHEGRGPTFVTALKGGLIGSLPGLAAAVVMGETVDAWAGVVGFSLAQGTVAGLYARAHTHW